MSSGNILMRKNLENKKKIKYGITILLFENEEVDFGSIINPETKKEFEFNVDKAYQLISSAKMRLEVLKQTESMAFLLEGFLNSISQEGDID